eukprot:jgi/Bigna1/70224/fgenesh1_pg.11_\
MEARATGGDPSLDGEEDFGRHDEKSCATSCIKLLTNTLCWRLIVNTSLGSYYPFMIFRDYYELHTTGLSLLYLIFSIWVLFINFYFHLFKGNIVRDHPRATHTFFNEKLPLLTGSKSTKVDCINHASAYQLSATELATLSNIGFKCPLRTPRLGTYKELGTREQYVIAALESSNRSSAAIEELLGLGGTVYWVGAKFDPSDNLARYHRENPLSLRRFRTSSLGKKLQVSVHYQHIDYSQITFNPDQPFGKTLGRWVVQIGTSPQLTTLRRGQIAAFEHTVKSLEILVEVRDNNVASLLSRLAGAAFFLYLCGFFVRCYNRRQRGVPSCACLRGSSSSTDFRGDKYCCSTTLCFTHSCLTEPWIYYNAAKSRWKVLCCFFQRDECPCPRPKEENVTKKTSSAERIRSGYCWEVDERTDRCSCFNCMKGQLWGSGGAFVQNNIPFNKYFSNMFSDEKKPDGHSTINDLVGDLISDWEEVDTWSKTEKLVRETQTVRNRLETLRGYE